MTNYLGLQAVLNGFARGGADAIGIYQNQVNLQEQQRFQREQAMSLERYREQVNRQADQRLKLERDKFKLIQDEHDFKMDQYDQARSRQVIGNVMGNLQSAAILDGYDDLQAYAKEKPEKVVDMLGVYLKHVNAPKLGYRPHKIKLNDDGSMHLSYQDKAGRSVPLGPDNGRFDLDDSLHDLTVMAYQLGLPDALAMLKLKQTPDGLFIGVNNQPATAEQQRGLQELGQVIEENTGVPLQEFIQLPSVQDGLLGSDPLGLQGDARKALQDDREKGIDLNPIEATEEQEEEETEVLSSGFHAPRTVTEEAYGREAGDDGSGKYVSKRDLWRTGPRKRSRDWKGNQKKPLDYSVFDAGPDVAPVEDTRSDLDKYRDHIKHLQETKKGRPFDPIRVPSKETRELEKAARLEIESGKSAGLERAMPEAAAKPSPLSKRFAEIDANEPDALNRRLQKGGAAGKQAVIDGVDMATRPSRMIAKGAARGVWQTAKGAFPSLQKVEDAFTRAYNDSFGDQPKAEVPTSSGNFTVSKDDKTVTTPGGFTQAVPRTEQQLERMSDKATGNKPMDRERRLALMMAWSMTQGGQALFGGGAKGGSGNALANAVLGGDFVDPKEAMQMMNLQLGIEQKMQSLGDSQRKALHEEEQDFINGIVGRMAKTGDKGQKTEEVAHGLKTRDGVYVWIRELLDKAAPQLHTMMPEAFPAMDNGVDGEGNQKVLYYTNFKELVGANRTAVMAFIEENLAAYQPGKRSFFGLINSGGYDPKEDGIEYGEVRKIFNESALGAYDRMDEASKAAYRQQFNLPSEAAARQRLRNVRP